MTAQRAPLIVVVYWLLGIAKTDADAIDAALALRALLLPAQRGDQTAPEPACRSVRVALAWAWAVIAQDQPHLAVLGPLAVLLLPATLVLIAVHWSY